LALFCRNGSTVQTQARPVQCGRSALVDAHTHIFCCGEKPADGFLSERTVPPAI